jgi:hypothetical protein
MREIGFDGYAIDFVDCAPAMRSFLTRDCQFHRTVSAYLIPLNRICNSRCVRRPAHCTPTEPRRPRTRDGSSLPYRRRQLHPWQHTEHGHALAIRPTSPAESHARRASSAHPRRTRRFVPSLLPTYLTLIVRSPLLHSGPCCTAKRRAQNR